VARNESDAKGERSKKYQKGKREKSFLSANSESPVRGTNRLHLQTQKKRRSRCERLVKSTRQDEALEGGGGGGGGGAGLKRTELPSIDKTETCLLRGDVISPN